MFFAKVFHLISNGLNGGFKFLCSILSKGTSPFDFIKGNVIRKLAYKVKYISEIKEEMYSTMNSYYKYKSIPKSSFYKINTLPINNGEKYLKYSIYFASICDYQPL